MAKSPRMTWKKWTPVPTVGPSAAVRQLMYRGKEVGYAGVYKDPEYCGARAPWQGYAEWEGTPVIFCAASRKRAMTQAVANVNRRARAAVGQHHVDRTVRRGRKVKTRRGRGQGRA